MTTVPADVALPLVSNARFVDEDEAFWRFVALRVDITLPLPVVRLWV
jgi:hypothetical protein